MRQIETFLIGNVMLSSGLNNLLRLCVCVTGGGDGSDMGTHETK